MAHAKNKQKATPNFADVIKLKILKDGEIILHPAVSKCNHKCPRKKWAEGDLRMEEKAV